MPDYGVPVGGDDFILWNRLPFPPSVNESLAAIGYRSKAGKIASHLVSTRVSRGFKDECETWRLKNLSLVAHTRTKVLEWKILRVDIICVIRHERMYTLKGQPKVFDVHNRIKPLHDAIATILNHDDKYFFAGDAEKVSIPPGPHLLGMEDHCIALISKHTPSTYHDLLHKR